MTANGGPAFPGGCILSETNEERGYPPQGDMTLRDFFAAHALTGLLARVSDDAGVYAEAVAPMSLAETAYSFADALLAAREQTA